MTPNAVDKPSQENNDSLWSANFILVCLSSLFLMFGFTSLVPTLPIYIEEYSDLTGVAGLPLAALTLGAVLTRPLTGWGLDVYGRRAILFGGLALFLLPNLIYIGMLPALFLIIFRFIQGAGFGVGNTSLSTVASDVVPARRLGEGMSIFTITISMAMAAGPSLGLWLIEEYSFPVFFSVVSGFSFISIMLMLLVRFPRRKIKQKGSRPKLVFMDKDCLPPAIIILLFTINNSAIVSFISLHAMEQGVANAGVFFVSMAFSTLSVRPFVGKMLDKRGSTGYHIAILAGTVAITAATLILSQVASIAYLVWGGICYGVGFGFIQPSMLALSISRLSYKKRGAANATYWTAYDLGVAIGSASWGVIGALAGYGTMFLLSIIPVASGGLFYFITAPRPEVIETEVKQETS